VMRAMELTSRQFLALGALALPTAAGLDRRRFDLILAGHSHGGQVRIPSYGPVVIP
jgi:hypothetical protein